MKVLLTAGGACSDELFIGPFSQAPFPERRAQRKTLDSTERMREKKST
jgi:hypothetical protein